MRMELNKNSFTLWSKRVLDNKLNMKNFELLKKSASNVQDKNR